jgi:hypothetical protein
VAAAAMLSYFATGARRVAAALEVWHMNITITYCQV